MPIHFLAADSLLFLNRTQDAINTFYHLKNQLQSYLGINRDGTTTHSKDSTTSGGPIPTAPPLVLSPTSAGASLAPQVSLIDMTPEEAQVRTFEAYH